MDFNQYQKKTKKTAIYPDSSVEYSTDGVMYTSLGLASEAGEVAGKIKKIFRDENGYFNYNNRLPVLDEMGDVLWYISELASLLGTDLETIAQMNIDKLEGRKERGVIGGSGDDR